MKPPVRWLLALAVAPSADARQRPAAEAGVMTLSVLDVGQGDAILIRSPEGKTALIDAGPSHHVVQLLKDRGVMSLDLLAISHHHHSDHYGGALAVLKAFPTRVFLYPYHNRPAYSFWI